MPETSTVPFFKSSTRSRISLFCSTAYIQIGVWNPELLSTILEMWGKKKKKEQDFLDYQHEA